MAKSFDIPSAPPPSAASAPEGVEQARARARRFLPDAVNLVAAIALGGGESAAHTKLLACKQLVEIAGLGLRSALSGDIARVSERDGPR